MRRSIIRFCVFFAAVLAVPLAAFLSPAGSVGVDERPSAAGQSSDVGEASAAEETVRLLRTGTGEVVELSMSDYVKGVVAAEIPMSYEPEAIKAQAVAAHTCALRMLQRDESGSKPEDADFSDDPSVFQAYVDREEFDGIYGEKAEEYREKRDAAVDEVMGKVLLYEEEPIAAAFHAVSSGRTESSEVVWGSPLAYLVPVESTEDRDAPSYLSERVFSASEAEELLKAAVPERTFDGKKETLFSVVETSASGTVTKIRVGEAELTGMQVRAALSLPSANFTVRYLPESDSFAFTVRGLGHGVGMSQNGANEMARAGKTYEEILTHYYTGVELADL